MSLIQVTDVVVQNNPAPFQKPFEFLITFECQSPGLKEELEWKLIYVGSAENEKLDQELDSVLVGPVAIGRNQFLFSAPPPNHAKIPEKDLLEVTVILLTCAYKDKEFIRIGYYVNNEYIDNDYQKLLNEVHTKNQLIMAKHQEDLKKNPSTPSPPFIPPPPLPSPLDIKKVQRNILSGKPRVTRFNIAWDLEEKMPELTVEERKELEEQRKQNELGGGSIENGGGKGGEANNQKLSTMDQGEDDDEEDDDDDDEEEEDNNHINNGEENIEDEEDEEEEEEEEEEEDDDQQNEMSISKKK